MPLAPRLPRHSCRLLVQRLRRALFLLLLPLILPAHAQTGAPATFLQTPIGPYAVLVSAHPPATVPGLMEIDLRLTRRRSGVRLTRATAVLDDGDPIRMLLSADGSATASLWITRPSSHTLHVALDGNRGPGAISITLPAAPIVAASPPPPHHLRPALLLASLLLFAAALLAFYRGRRDSSLAIPARPANAATAPGHTAPHWTPSRVATALFAAAFALAAIAIASRAVRPHTALRAQLAPGGRLDITLSNPEESFSDLVPDDGKLLHLFLIRKPGADILLHLHPRPTASGPSASAAMHAATFTTQLPAMPAGRYTLYADLYHREDDTGLAARNETAILTLDLPAQTTPASATDPDDSSAALPPLSQSSQIAVAAPIRVAEAGMPFLPQPQPVSPPAVSPAPSLQQTVSFDASHKHALHSDVLPDGFIMQLRSRAQLVPRRANLLHVTLLTPTGQPPDDMRLYLGMTAHAIILRTGGQASLVPTALHPGAAASDGEVFAHIHPGSTLPMLTSTAEATPMPASSNTAAIPYGFPTPGRYRIFVQMKHGATIETAAFDLTVE